MNKLIATSDQGIVIAGENVTENPALIYLASLGSAESRRTMQGSLNRIAQIVLNNDEATFIDVPWGQLRFQHTQAIRSALLTQPSLKTGKPYSPAAINKTLAALRGTLKSAWRLGLISAEALAHATDLKRIPNETPPAGRDIQRGELGALLDTCKNDKAGIRDAAMIALLYACGLRRAELAALDLEDFDGDMLRVLGKGRKVREVPCGAALPLLDDWLAIRNDVTGVMFISLGNRSFGKRLTTQAVYHMLRRRAKAAGIAKLSPHDFRRTFVGDLLDAGADIATVQQMAGHANVNTTARYDRRGKDAKRKAATLLHVPTKRRQLQND
ncbi:MAG: tyrosine-type recombinase/integrase [Candidatus Promineifilaceae bacterium]